MLILISIYSKELSIQQVNTRVSSPAGSADPLYRTQLVTREISPSLWPLLGLGLMMRFCFHTDPKGQRVNLSNHLLRKFSLLIIIELKVG
jgi:hypothetical protein